MRSASPLINTVLNDRMDLHLQRLHDSVTWGSAVALERIDDLEQSLERMGSDAGDAALKALSGTVRTQALVMSFADVFLILTAMFLAMACATVLIKRPQMAGGAGALTRCATATSTAALTTQILPPSSRPLGTSMPPGITSMRDLAIGQRRLDRRQIRLGGVGRHTKPDMHQHPPARALQHPAYARQIIAPDRVAHRARGGLGRILPLQVHAHAKLDEHGWRHWLSSLSARQRRPLASFSSKLAGSSHASNAAFRCGPFPVDDRVPGRVAVAALVKVAWRKMPSNVKPSRSAAARDGALSASHFHS